MPGESLSFSIRHTPAFLRLGTPEDTSALLSGAVLNSEIADRSAENVAPDDLDGGREDACLQYKVKQESRVSPCSILAGDVRVG